MRSGLERLQAGRETKMLSPEDIGRWMSLYAATGVCCFIAMVLSVTRVATMARAESIISNTKGWKSWLLLGPKLWWRWQKVYLTTTPVTLLIVCAFAWSMDWST